jgi:hypothetical protein
MYTDFMKEKANLSTRNRQEMCMLAKSFRYQHSLVAIIFVQFLMSFLTLIILYRICKSPKLGRVFALVEMDLKVSFWRLEGIG